MAKKTVKAYRKRKLSESQLNVDVQKSTVDGLNRFCAKNGLKRKAVIELAILKFLNTSQQARP